MLDAIRMPVFMPVVVFAIAVPAFGQARPQTFCERLAPQLQMKWRAATANSTDMLWRTDTANLGMHFFGGSTTIGMNVTPVDRTNAAEFIRLESACQGSNKGAICQLEGPAIFSIRTRRFTATIEMPIIERAEVEVRGSIVTCRDRQ